MNKKAETLTLLSLIYLTGFIPSLILFINLPRSVYSLLLCDLLYTIVIFIFSLVLNNSSIYDPYWSLIPMLFLLAFPICKPHTIILSIAVLYWGFRLTVNCLANTGDLKSEDWRYQCFRNAFSKHYWLISLFAVHVFPTLMVFINMKNVFWVLEHESVNAIIFAIGILLCLGGTTVSLVADTQMKLFRRTCEPKSLCRKGLWNYSRHPNYLGEVAFWWGIWVCSLGAGSTLIHIVSPVLMTALFLFYSIPAMEKRQMRKNPQYMEIQKTTSSLLLLPKRR